MHGFLVIIHRLLDPVVFLYAFSHRLIVHMRFFVNHSLCQLLVHLSNHLFTPRSDICVLLSCWVVETYDFRIGYRLGILGFLSVRNIQEFLQ